MHKNAGKKICRLFQTAVLILMSAQILTGCVWGLLNFSRLQPFPDTADLVSLSGSLNLTGDTGIIYPALLILVRTLTVNGPVLFYHVMYLIQLILAFVSWYVFAGNVFESKSKLRNAFLAAAVVTNPYAMQVHLAVLEYSFVSSFAALLVSYQIRFMCEWKNARKCPGLERALGDISVTSLFWLLIALSRKEFITVGFIPVLALIITIIRRFVKEKGKASAIVWPVIVALAFAGIILMTDSLFRTGERLSPVASVKRSLYYRVAWNEDFRDRYHWPEYLTSFVDEGMMTHFMNDPGLIRSEFTDYVTDRLGEEDTTEKFWEWGRIAFSRNKKNIVKEILSDMLGYIFAPAKTEYSLRGCEYPGYAAGNYDVMKQHDPGLTKFYLRYFSMLYIVMAAVSVIAALACFVKKSKEERRIKVSLYLPVFLIVMLTSVYYTFLGCNVYDHRKAVFTTCLWIVCLCFQEFSSQSA